MIKDETGLSYSIAVILMLLIIFSIVFLALAESGNMLTQSMNDNIDNPNIHISEDTKDTFDLSSRILKSVPLFLIVGIVLWGLGRAQEID